MTTHRALVREIGDAYANATVRGAVRPRIDVGRAHAQHHAYVRALEACGVSVHVLPADPELPDACFVEDQVVVADGVGLVARSGHPGRRAEAAAVARALSEHVDLAPARAPACLDGGDVLRVGKRLYVGRSDRTNEAGVAALRERFGPLGLSVREVAVRDALHLKCHCSSPAPGVVLLARGFLSPSVFDDVADVVEVPEAEAYAANAVGVGGRVLVAAGFPETRRRLEARGLDVIPLEVDAIAAGDGSLTCLSVLF